MSTRSNYYKNAAYSYAREFDLNSVLENLHSYRVAAGEVAGATGIGVEVTPIDRRANESESRLAEHDEHLCKRVRQDPGAAGVPSCLGKRKYEEESLLAVDPHTDYLSKAFLRDGTSKYGATFISEDWQSKAQVTSIFGYEPYDKGSEELDQPKNRDEDLGNTLLTAENLQLDESPSNGVIKCSSDQRFAGPGEPVCCRCGRYGEYICDETGDDVCSLDCKAELLQAQADEQREKAKATTLSFVAHTPLADALQIPEVEPDKWDLKKHRWTYRQTSLSTFRCWKCKRPGHLPEDCTSTLGMVAQSPSDPTRFEVTIRKNDAVSAELRSLYQRCRQLRATAKGGCKQCGRQSNLAACLDCSDIFCDSEGHLTGHLLNNSQHRQLYSFKLKRLVKCSKGTCAVTRMTELFVCHFCFSKAFDKFYSMYTASWKGEGLKIVYNAVCCDDHFDWHRINCPHADVEESAHLISKDGSNLGRAQFSEFLF